MGGEAFKVVLPVFLRLALLAALGGSAGCRSCPACRLAVSSTILPRRWLDTDGGVLSILSKASRFEGEPGAVATGTCEGGGGSGACGACGTVGAGAAVESCVFDAAP